MSREISKLIVIQPSVDYAERVIAAGEDAVFVVGPDRAAAFEELSPTVFVDTFSVMPVLKALREWARRHNTRYSGLTCFVCEHLPFSAELAAAMGLRFPDPAVVHRSRRKDLAHARWVAAGIPTPVSRSVKETSDLLEFAEVQDPPWVIKPSNGTGSAWVSRIDRRTDLVSIFERQSDGADFENHGKVPFVIQSLVAGREVSADFFVDGDTLVVLRATAKLMSSRMGEVIAYYPAVLEDEERQAITDVLQSAAKALGLKRGLANADLMMTDSGPVVLEMALRPGGDCLPDLCKAAHGYDPIREACRAARGLLPQSERPWVEEVSFAAVHLLSDRSGVIEDLSFGDLAADDSVVSFEPYASAGDTLAPESGCYEDRIVGACLVRTASLEDLAAHAKSLVEKVQVRMRDVELLTALPTATAA